MTRQAHENPVAFMALLGKLIPSEIKAELVPKRKVTIQVVEAHPAEAARRRRELGFAVARRVEPVGPASEPTP